MRVFIYSALLGILALGCSEPGSQEFGPSTPPLPGPSTPEPILYSVSAGDVIAAPDGADGVVFDIVLAVTHAGREVEGAAVYLWASAGVLSGTEFRSGTHGWVAVTWRVAAGNRAILSACAVPLLQDPCLPTVVVRRDT